MWIRLKAYGHFHQLAQPHPYFGYRKLYVFLFVVELLALILKIYVLLLSTRHLNSRIRNTQ